MQFNVKLPFDEARQQQKEESVQHLYQSSLFHEKIQFILPAHSNNPAMS